MTHSIDRIIKMQEDLCARLPTRMIHPGARKIIQWHGPMEPEMIIVMEAPGESEVLRGYPAAGATGHILDNLLSNAGLERTSCLVTNVIDVRPPSNKVEVYYVDERRKTIREELYAWQNILREKLRFINCSTVLALGNIAMWATTDFPPSGIEQRRGSIVKCALDPKKKVICSIHPIYLYHSQSDNKSNPASHWSPVLQFDVERAVDWSRKEGIPKINKSYTINPDIHQILNTFARLGGRAKSEGRLRLAFDVENHGPNLTVFGIAWSREAGICIPVMTLKGKNWTNTYSLEQELEIWRGITRLARIKEIEWVMHNANHDRFHMAYYGVLFHKLYMDTMLSHNACYPVFPSGLHFVCSFYTERPYYKTDRKASIEGIKGHSLMEKSSSDRYQNYNLDDCCTTLEGSEAIDIELEELGLTELYHQHIAIQVEASCEMTLRGSKLDWDTLDKLRVEVNKKKTAAEDKMAEIVGYGLKAGSHKKLKAEFQKRAGKAGAKLRDTGEASIKRLKKLVPDLALVDHTLEARKWGKQYSTYLNIDFDEDRRQRSSTAACALTTFRWRSGKTGRNTGFNDQTLPYVLRDIVVADEGYELVYADSERAELWMVAWIGHVDTMLQLLREGVDLHTLHASVMLKMTVEEVTNSPNRHDNESIERYVGKKTGHAADYDVGARRSCEELLKDLDIVIQESEMKRYLQRYHDLHPRVKTGYQQRVVDLLNKQKHLESPFGHKISFFTYNNEVKRKALAWMPQTTVSGIASRAVETIYTKHKWIQILKHMHDGLLCQAPTGRTDEAMDVILEAMTQPFMLFGQRKSIPAEAKSGRAWGSLGGSRRLDLQIS